MENDLSEVESSELMDGNVNGLEKISIGDAFLTPEKKLGLQNADGQVVRSELYLSSGEGIFATPNEGSESSLASSESELESYDSTPEKMLKHDIENMEIEISEQENSYETKRGAGSDEYEMLMRQVLDYKEELKVSQEKLDLAEHEISRQRRELENKEAIIVKVGSIEIDLVSSRNEIKLLKAELEEENNISMMFQKQIFDLEANSQSEKTQVQDLQKQLSYRDAEIETLNAQLQKMSLDFTLQKKEMESSVSVLSSRNNELQKQLESLEAERVEMLKTQEAMKASWKDRIDQVNFELHDKNVMVDTLNQNLDKLKLDYDMVVSEKDEFTAKLQTLSGDLSVRDDQIQHMEHNLDRLRSENGGANSLITELRSRINELGDYVGLQKMEISVIGEEKREAIRQLCFALDHYRSLYHELHDNFAVSKRRTGMIL